MHLDVPGFNGRGLHLLQSGYIDYIRRIRFRRFLCRVQLFPHIPGQVFVRRHPAAFRDTLPHARRVSKNSALQCTDDPVLVLRAQELRHIWKVHARAFGNGNSQRFAGCPHLGRGPARLDGALCEHVRFALEVPFVIEHLQRAQKEISAVVPEYARVPTAVDAAIPPHKIVVQPVQPVLLQLYRRVSAPVKLYLHEPARLAAQRDQLPHTARIRPVQLHRAHDGVFPEVQPAVHLREAVIAHIRVRGQHLDLLFRLFQRQRRREPCVQPFQCGVQRRAQVLSRTRAANGAGTERAAFHHHIAQHHFRMLRKILVDGHAVPGLSHMQPRFIPVRHAFALLQEQDIRRHLCARALAERVAGQAHRADQFAPLGDVPPHIA